jgi:hypothetical protein
MRELYERLASFACVACLGSCSARARDHTSLPSQTPGATQRAGTVETTADGKKTLDDRQEIRAGRCDPQDDDAGFDFKVSFAARARTSGRSISELSSGATRTMSDLPALVSYSTIGM